MRTPRIAVVGTGGIAESHLKGWLGFGAVPVGYLEPDPARLAAFRERVGTPAVPALASVADAARVGADLVVIATPPHLHAPQTHEALDAGLQVVVEKPVAPSLRELDALLAHARAAGLLVLPTFQNRWGRGPTGLRAVQAAGLTGRFLHGTIETCWRRTAQYWAHPWRGRYQTAVGGAWACLAIHAIDTCLGFLPPVESVQAHLAANCAGVEVDAGGAALVQCVGGAWLALSASTQAHEQSTRGRLVFERCQVEFGPDPYGWAAPAWTIHAAEPADMAAIAAVLSSLSDECVVGQDLLWSNHTRRCLHAWRTGDGTGCDLASARPVTELLGALYASGHRGGAPVAVPVTDGSAAAGPFGPA